MTPSENLKLVRAMVEQFATSQTLGDAVGEDFVWDMSGFRGWPDEPRYEGREAFSEFFRSWTASFDDWSQEIEQIEDVGDDRVLVIIRQHARIKGSDVRADMQYAALGLVVAGEVREAQVYSSERDAREALESQPQRDARHGPRPR